MQRALTPNSMRPKSRPERGLSHHGAFAFAARAALVKSTGLNAISTIAVACVPSYWQQTRANGGMNSTREFKRIVPATSRKFSRTSRRGA